MTIAIMQPYLFPYIGYFQMIHAVDKFILLDDVNFIKKGWINRNRILVNNKDHLFTVPLQEISQNKLINELYLVNDIKWKTKLNRTLEDSYKKAPYYKNVSTLIYKIINSEKLKLSEYIYYSLKELNNYLGITTEIIPTSSVYNNSNLKAQDKIIDICKELNADVYINAIGGKDLYKTETFRKEGIELTFIKSLNIEYPQFQDQFIPWLSIIDLLMFNSQENLKSFLNQYEFMK